MTKRHEVLLNLPSDLIDAIIMASACAKLLEQASVTRKSNSNLVLESWPDSTGANFLNAMCDKIQPGRLCLFPATSDNIKWKKTTSPGHLFREKITPLGINLLVMWSPGHTALSASTNSKRATVLDWEWTESSPRHLSDPGGSHVLSRSIRTDSCWHLARRRWLTLARLRSRMAFLALVSL